MLRSTLAVSAASLLSDSKWSSAGALLLENPVTPSAPSPREDLLFDFGWKFSMGNACDPLRDLGFAKDQGGYEEGFSKAGGFSFATEKFDDSKWRLLNLPHDWAVELPYVSDPDLSDHGFKPLGRK